MKFVRILWLEFANIKWIMHLPQKSEKTFLVILMKSLRVGLPRYGRQACRTLEAIFFRQELDLLIRSKLGYEGKIMAFPEEKFWRFSRKRHCLECTGEEEKCVYTEAMLDLRLQIKLVKKLTWWFSIPDQKCRHGKKNNIEAFFANE